MNIFQAMSFLLSWSFLATVYPLTISAGFAANPGAVQAQTSPRAIVENTTHAFGHAEQGTKLAHRFTIRNAGTSPLTITRVSLSAPGMTAKVAPTILPGKEETLSIEWNTAGAKGTVEGKVVLDVNDPSAPQLAFMMTAVVEEAIEFLPYQAVFASVYQGEPCRRSVRVVNNREQALDISRVERQGDHFEASVKPIEPGRTYELEVTVPGTVPPGRYSEAVFLYTNDPKIPRHMVPVNIIVKADVSVNPEAVDFGRVNLKQLAGNPSSADLLTQTLIVRKRAGKFSIASVTSEIASVTTSRSPDGTTTSDAFRIDVVLVKEALRPGPINGSIRIRTTDERFPELVVPVRGVIE